MKALLITLFLFLSLQANELSSLESLLHKVEVENSQKEQMNAQREKAFFQDLENSKKLLSEAKKALNKEKATTKKLKHEFEVLSQKIEKQESLLESKKGELSEIFATIRLESRDLASALKSSMVSSEEPSREAYLEKLSRTHVLPSIEEIKQFWLIYFNELVKSGEISTYEAEVIRIDGSIHKEKVTRLGLFSAYSDNEYIRFDTLQAKMSELLRQPSSDKVAMIQAFDTTNSIVPIVIDPTRGVLFSMLKERATILERVDMGGVIGYIILSLGALILLFALFRLAVLIRIEININREKKEKLHSENNPLGRILRKFEKSQHADIDTIESKLDAAILKELPSIQSGLSLIKLVAAVAPLLGLLGTVTGMIETFQAITLFGSGDAKLMASGISQALMTTVLGLVVAIPTLFIHSLLNSRSKRIMEVLTQQSSALLADEFEKRAQK